MFHKIILILFYLTYTLGKPRLRNGLPPEIINGTDAEVGEFPFMAGIYYEGLFTCGGSILSEEWILTAAHCVYDRDESEFSVLTGTIDLADPDGTETLVDEIIIHQDYQYSLNQCNDIALLRLAVPLELDALTSPVTLSHPASDPQPNSPIVVMGWGVTRYKGLPMHLLQKVTVDVYSNSQCEKIYSPYGIEILPTNVCAGLPKGGVGQCTGDSGGPVVVEGSPSVQIGIISFSAKPCGVQGFPGVHTRVSQYIDWIKEQTQL